MRNNNQVVKTFLLVILVLISLGAISQTDSSSKGVFFKLGYSNTYTSTIYSGMNAFHFIHPSFQGEFSYSLNRIFDLGLNLGYSPLLRIVDKNQPFPREKDYKKWMYGINSNFHILPLFIDAKDYRIDVYAKGKVGMVSNLYHFENEYNREFDYGIYGGLAFYPTRHFGIFCEGGYGKGTKLLFGLCGKF